MYKKYLIIFVLIAILGCNFSFAAAKKPIWPLDIKISQSSSFAEFRGFRFHAGIDLRTKRKTGFPVKAIEDGYISRIKVQFRGYGYALYIDHPKINKKVVYGHLRDFSGKPKQYVDKKLKRIGQRFGIDDYFKANRFPVKKGQVVGFTGETGAGPPHLHFEMRTMNNEPVAPALSGYRPPDNIYPNFYKFYLEPFSFPCEINRSFSPYEVRIRKRNRKNGFLPNKIYLSGEAGLKVGISDNNGAGNVYTIEKVNFKLNGKKGFAREFYKYSYSQNYQCSLVYDYLKSKMRNTGYVINMFKLPGETLPFAKEYKTWSGMLNPKQFPSGKLQLSAQDYGRNLIELTGYIEFHKADYERQIDADIISGFVFNNVEYTHKYLIAHGKSKGKRRRFLRGSIESHNSQNYKKLLPCLISGNRIEIAIPFEKHWEKGAWIKDIRILPENTFISANGGQVSMENGGEAVFNGKSLFFPVLARFVKTNLSPQPAGNSKTGRLAPYSPVWTLKPDKRVFASSVRIRIKPAKYEGDPQKLGIYKVGNNNKYYHVGEKYVDGWFEASTRLGGSWTILEDKVKPYLRYKRRGSTYHLGKVWVFAVSDFGEGVDYLSAEAYAGKEKFEVYSDPDKSEIYVVRPSKSRNIKLKLQVKDYAGNVGEIIKTLK
ncbi:MAG: M23 family metallopeptidase [Candidatus Rifleibacteriota bacterium]